MNPARYRYIYWIGDRILQGRELNKLQAITHGVDASDNLVTFDLDAIYQEGATFNVTPTIVSSTVSFVPTNSLLPMLVFVRGRWEVLASGEAAPVTLTTGQTQVFLNWQLVIRTNADDSSLVDAGTGEPTAQMGELVLQLSNVDTSATPLNPTTQFEVNTAPVVLFTFTSSGGVLTLASTTSVKPQALATAKQAGPVLLTTGTSSGQAVASDDPRLGDARTPLAVSVVDASVRAPVPDGSGNYSIGADPGGISNAKIVHTPTHQTGEAALEGVRATANDADLRIASHINRPLGGGVHPMPTAADVGAAPASHVGQALGLSTSHPPQVNANSGGFSVNQSAGTFVASANDPAYAVNENGVYKAGLEHGGDVFSALLASLVAAPGGTPLTFTGPLHGMMSMAQVLIDHVNQKDGTTNPHGTTSLSLSSVTVAGGSGSSMKWLILRFAPNGTNAIEVAVGAGTTRSGQFVPLPNVNFGYTNFLGSPSIGLGMGHGTTYNNIHVAMNIGPDGVTVVPGQVYCGAWNNVGAGIPGEVDTGNPMIANIFALTWRVGA